MRRLPAWAVLTAKMATGIFLAIGVIGGGVWLALDRSSTAVEGRVENRTAIDRNTTRIVQAEAKINGTLRCLQRAKDPQSCLDRVAGPKGPGGASGSTGRAGVQGERGERGERGLSVVGKAGPQGEPGAKGDPGENGRPGKDAEPAVNGQDGLNGVNGTDGIDGVSPPPPPMVPCAALDSALGYQCVPPPVVDAEPVPSP